LIWFRIRTGGGVGALVNMVMNSRVS
jgi:hypothetical protein